jgi:hypothetical protein
MPKKTITNYTFYKLCSDNCQEFYIGSTSNFNNRKHKHKQSINNSNQKDYNTKKACFIRENGGWDSWKMIPIDIKKDLTKREAEMYENELIQKYKPQLNTMLKTYVTKEQAKQQKKEYDKVYSLEYRKKEYDKVKKAESDKKYREANKDKIAERKKEWRENNKDKIAEKKKAYREANKDKINEKQREHYKKKKEEGEIN